jgi:homoserine O-succinyltransferase/O-acetyltransferase
MTVVLPKDYHAKDALEKKRISCLNYDQAIHQDIRALRIGILNIMPKAETYEYSLLFPLGRTPLQIEPIWLRLRNHNYNSTNSEHLEKLYQYFDDAIKTKHLDGLIITGAPVEEMPFEQVTYWKELIEILEYARKNIAGTLGICWGGLAIAKFLGIEKTMFNRKIFGVYETKNLNINHRITGEMDDIFFSPQSRHSGIKDKDLEIARDKGVINLLAHSPATGYTIFESTDHKFLVHLGHPEYDAKRFIEEYQRDLSKGRNDVLPPVNVDINNPVNRWRGHCFEFFSQWIKFVYEETPF